MKTNNENVSCLLNRYLSKIGRLGDKYQGDELIFTLDSGERYKMYHNQGCCEHVYIESIVGNLDDLIDSPLTMSEEQSDVDEIKGLYSRTWTFYKFATVKGYVTIRWCGESNGHYSESVDFQKL
jgi:hypothetical protein